VPVILVIDDDEALRKIIRAVLEGEGYEVDCAADGAEGIKAQSRRPADLVLCDLFMPVKEGLETIRELRAQFPDLKVIAMSGGCPRDGRMDYLPMTKYFGAAAMLHKPFRPRELTEAIANALRG
jgi:DNA-binding response OmpR family regulator